VLVASFGGLVLAGPSAPASSPPEQPTMAREMIASATQQTRQVLDTASRFCGAR